MSSLSRRLVPALLLPALLLSACTTPARRIERKLVEAGVPPPQARCLGDRLASRLSTAELRALDRLARRAADPGRLRPEDLGPLLADADNPALLAKVVRTGLGCLV